MSLQDEFGKLKPGDIFYARYPAMVGEGRAICLVIETCVTTVTARTVTTQMTVDFDRKTLTGRQKGSEGGGFIVTSTKPLPDSIHALMLELDHKFDPNNPMRDPKLSRAQIDALAFAAEHYK